MNKALICVDVQPDFLPGGPLGVPDGHLVIRPLIELMNDVDIIALTQDWHPANHISFSTTPAFEDGSWPQHCVQFTPGAAIDDELLHAARDTGKPVINVHKGMHPNIEAYSGFEGTVTGHWNPTSVQELYDLTDSTLKQAFTALSVSRVLIGGLALDYCVEATALDAARDYPTTVYFEATRPVAYASGARAIANMTNRGIHFSDRDFR